MRGNLMAGPERPAGPTEERQDKPDLVRAAFPQKPDLVSDRQSAKGKLQYMLGKKCLCLFGLVALPDLSY